MKKVATILLAGLGFGLIQPRCLAGKKAPAADETGALIREMKGLKESQEAFQKALLKDMEEIKQLLRGRAGSPAPAPTPAPSAPSSIRLTASPFRGDAAAPVVLIDYSDYQ